MKSLIILTILLTIAIPNINSEVVCPDDTACQNGQTCCRNRGGYGCCSHPRAQCCADKVHCCPGNTVCDVSSDRCLPQGLMKLAYQEIMQIPFTQPAQKQSKPQVALTKFFPHHFATNSKGLVKAILEIFSSFLESFGLTNLSEIALKNAESLSKMKQIIKKLIQDIHAGDAGAISTDLVQLALTVQEAYKYNAEAWNRDELSYEVGRIIGELLELTRYSTKYYNLIIENVQKHFAEFITLYQKMSQALTQGDYKLVGATMADALKLLFKEDDVKQLQSGLKVQMTPECEKIMEEYLNKIKEFYRTKSLIWDYKEFFALILEFKSIKEKC